MARNKRQAIRKSKLYIYTQELKTPMGRPNGERVWALFSVAWRQFGRRTSVDLAASSKYLWSGAHDATELGAILRKEGHEVQFIN